MTNNIRLEGVQQVYNDGNHNAFTDLCRFKDQYYLTFRNCPDGHMLYTTSRIMVLSSLDGKVWQVVHTFNVPDRDVRDPHFLLFKDKLFVCSGTWLVDPTDPQSRTTNEHQGYCVWSEDGTHWQGPTLMTGTYGYYIWRAAAYGDTAYLNGRRIRDFLTVSDRNEEYPLRESWLLQSQDGFVWEPVGLFQPEYGDETAFLFEADGSILAVARSAAARPAQVCRAKPPYQDWLRKDLAQFIGGPMLAKWGDHYLVGGRKRSDNADPTTVLYWLIQDRSDRSDKSDRSDSLVEILELPSGGDTSYPGFIELESELGSEPGSKQGLLSYYSSHEGSGTGLAPSAIYLAELSLV